jgi:O-antigen/teichoic acid export membrane protein
MGVEGAILGQLVGFTAGGTVAYAQSRGLFRLRIDRAKLRQMLGFSLPLVPASSGVFLNGYADRLAIQSQSTLHDLGLYGVAYRLSVVVSLTLIGFQGALLPQVIRQRHHPETPGELVRLMRLFVALALTVLVLVTTFADELLLVLTRPAYYSAADAVPFVVAGAFFAGMPMFAVGFSVAQRTKPIAFVTVGCGLANLGLALLLVGPIGILGAGLSFLVTQAIAFAILMRLSQRLYPVAHDWRRLIVGTVVGGALTAAGWALPSAGDHLWALAAKVALAAVAATTLALVLMDADERAMGRRGLRSLRSRYLTHQQGRLSA